MPTGDCWGMLANTEILEAIQCTFENSIGVWIFALVFLWIAGMIYIRTQSGSAVAVFGIFMSSIMFYYGALGSEALPAFGVAAVIIVLSVTIMIYSVFFRKSNF